MPPSEPLHLVGRILLFTGVLLAVTGLVLLLGVKLPGLGRLPGDLTWTRGNVEVHVPITTSLLISLVLTLILALISWLRR